MSQQPTTNPLTPAAQTADPWSPLTVAFITLFLPAGGIVLAIRNLQRLGQMEARAASHLVWTAIGVMTAGYTLLLLTAAHGADGLPKLDSNAGAFLSVGLGVTVYLTLRSPFTTWRAHSSDHTAAWLPAIGVAILYQLIVFVCVVVVVVAATPVLRISSSHVLP